LPARTSEPLARAPEPEPALAASCRRGCPPHAAAPAGARRPELVHNGSDPAPAAHLPRPLQALSYTREAYAKKLQRIKGLGSSVNDNMTYNGGFVHTNLDVVLIFLGSWSSAKAKQTAALITYFAANANNTLWLKTGRRYLPDPHLQPEGSLNPGNVRLRVSHASAGRCRRGAGPPRRPAAPGPAVPPGRLPGATRTAASHHHARPRLGPRPPPQAVSTIIAPKNSTFTDKGIRSIIRKQITTGSVPLLPETGAYFILTTPDVRFEDHCTAYCGYHGIFSYQSAVMDTTVSLAYRWARPPARWRCGEGSAGLGAEFGPWQQQLCGLPASPPCPAQLPAPRPNGCSSPHPPTRPPPPAPAQLCRLRLPLLEVLLRLCLLHRPRLAQRRPRGRRHGVHLGARAGRGEWAVAVAVEGAVAVAVAVEGAACGCRVLPAAGGVGLELRAAGRPAEVAGQPRGSSSGWSATQPACALRPPTSAAACLLPAQVLTDPFMDAWYDDNGLENADKCGWQRAVAVAVADCRKAVTQLASRLCRLPAPQPELLNHTHTHTPSPPLAQVRGATAR
jgi:hypothetical protein